MKRRGGILSFFYWVTADPKPAGNRIGNRWWAYCLISRMESKYKRHPLPAEFLAGIANFGAKSFKEALIAGQRMRKKLQCDGLPQPEIVGSVYFTHTALS